MSQRDPLTQSPHPAHSLTYRTRRDDRPPDELLLLQLQLFVRPPRRAPPSASAIATNRGCTRRPGAHVRTSIHFVLLLALSSDDAFQPRSTWARWRSKKNNGTRACASVGGVSELKGRLLRPTRAQPDGDAGGGPRPPLPCPRHRRRRRALLAWPRGWWCAGQRSTKRLDDDVLKCFDDVVAPPRRVQPQAASYARRRRRRS